MNNSILPPHRQAIYNPGRLSDEEIKASYIARESVLESILEDIDGTKGIPQHHLIIGQRGMGKTTLLHRLDVALREQERSKKFIPLRFPEEQWTIDRLSKLWLNCLDSLADTLEREGHSEDVVDEIDQIVRQLDSDFPKEDLRAEAAERLFVEVASRIQRRPVLLVDNLDLVFARLKKHELNRLRAFLMRAGTPILIGACVSPPLQTLDYSAPFYDHFKTHYLERLSETEMRDVLLKLAERTGNETLRNRLVTEQPRLKALHALTGGNPRTTVILFQIFTKGFSQEAYEDLEALLDWITPLYKARLEELPPQAQVVISAIATHWEPATAAQLSAVTRLQNNQLSPQLDRLKKTGILEEVVVDPEHKVGPLPKGRDAKTRTGYQLAERFFNIWFLMRQATRRDRRNLTFLTRFLESVHTADERSALARELLCRRGLSRGERVYGLALEPSIAEAGLRYELHDHVQQEIVEAHRALREKIEEIIDPSEIPPHRFAFAELRAKLKQLVPVDSTISGEIFADQILSSPGFIDLRDGIVNQTLDAAKVRELSEAASQYADKLRQSFGASDADWFLNLLRRGTVTDFRDARQASESFLRADTTAKAEIILKHFDDDIFPSISQDAWNVAETLLQPKTGAQASEWTLWGFRLHRTFNRVNEAERACRRSIELNPELPAGWDNLGDLLHEELNRDTEAEASYKRAIELDANYVWAWAGFGNLMCKLNRFEEAEQAYRRAVELRPDNTYFNERLAGVLEVHLDKPKEAEAVLRKLIEIAPTNADAWYELGRLLTTHFHNYDEAEVALRKAIELASRTWSYWATLGTLLQIQSRDEEAETAFRKAIEVDPKRMRCRIVFARFLEAQGRFKDALDEYRKGAEIGGMSWSDWNGFGLFLCDNLGHGAEAESAFRKAIELNPAESLIPMYNLISVLRDHQNDIDAARRLYMEIPPQEDAVIASAMNLHATLFAAYSEDWGVARERLASSLDLILEFPAFPEKIFPAWMRTTAVLLHLGYGAKLLEFLHEEGYMERLRPWYEAIRAHDRGDRGYLRNIPLEMQDVTGKLYDEIDIRRKILPKTTQRGVPAKPVSRRRSKGGE